MSAALRQDAVVAVIGAGTMGAGIAQVAAQAGHTVRLFDLQPGAAECARADIASAQRRQVDKGRLEGDAAEAALRRIEPVAAIGNLAGAALVVEAIVERLEPKRALFAELEDIVDPSCILASNTSSLSITALAAPLRHPRRVLGMHFFNPVPVMKLVEVVSGLATDPLIAACVHASAQAWGKRAVHARSTPGFIVNRVARPYYGEALRLIEEQVASPQTIDRVLREAGGFRMGPFELMDLIGHDVNYAVTASVFEAYYQDPRFRPSLVQKQLVDAGRLGRKSGFGFYDYCDGQRAERTEAETAAVPSPRLPGRLRLSGDVGPAEALCAGLCAVGAEIEAGPPASPYGRWSLEAAEGVLALSDGRSATQVAADSGRDDVVLCDWSASWNGNKGSALAVATAAQAGAQAPVWAAGLLRAAGQRAQPVRDVPGLVVLRIVAMLANEAADAVNQGVASAGDVDAAMRDGVNYPQGPLAWADAIGVAAIHGVLGHLQSHYEEDRYRASPLIKQRLWAKRGLSEEI